MIQKVGTASVEAEISEFVDEEQVVRGPRGESTLQGVLGLTGDEIVHEVGCGRELDAMTAQAGELTDRVGEMGLPDAGWPDEHAVRFLGEEVQGRGAKDEIAIDLLGVVEVIRVDRREREDRRPLECDVGAVLGLDT